MSYYKVQILSLEAAADAAIHADANLQLRVSRNPDVFQDVRNGHRTVVLSAAEVMAITTNAALTQVQKRQALKDLIKVKVLAMGIDVSDEAYAAFIALVPVPFDVAVRDVV
jgi:hypothetical protein